jgi:hypothetical protein
VAWTPSVLNALRVHLLSAPAVANPLLLPKMIGHARPKSSFREDFLARPGFKPIRN